MVKLFRRQSVVVIGLGRFGMALSEELEKQGVEVLGLDMNREVVARATEKLSHAVVGSGTDEAALKQLGVQEARRVVIAIGSDLAASVLAAQSILDLGAPNVWAKADGDAHEKILKRIGVHHTIRPERDTGRRIAHLIGGAAEEYVEFDHDFSMIKLAPPVNFLGLRVEETPQGVDIVAVRKQGGRFTRPVPGQRIESGDIIIVAGALRSLESFAAS
ncbi:TrkA family potassium uptake protein [Corynebacterium sp. ES2794-CONJ1]|uniref:potassium channel family protein n=1 Tax=unclassified Corynebacterium TaxID=2624378 RepID=UPI002166EE96|nr:MULTISPECIES: TrkA family potassium uptake protein [unclassified Corynebacterium]MCS4489666.1 TrkA family potassium uptake protein [Corynebacterium sp. ES2775-CONJ]MCS4491325.1 TrkA family potassium uptake protein [Corynebacterium sp. ES2715-CONJ3]MCS4531578.1 TrkA family potassium uptake protein [Corynebacterium sp. ES2730-CONJ]MCU9518974.1 TrkA family potassium uptake protein [Corynebacterium sp. ES2794-CONJ1]